MLFNVEKCKVIHFGYNNKQHNYFLGEECIQAELKEKDLGVIIRQNLKSSSQCAAAVKFANRMPGIFK